MLNLPEYVLEDETILTAAALLAQRWRVSGAPRITPPQAVIICYQRDPITALRRRYRYTGIDGFHNELHLLKTRGQSIGVLHPGGPGAPNVTVAVEELIAFGVRRFVSIGLAGGLQPELHTGDVVLGDGALRDEGTSYHYLPPARSVASDPALVQQIDAALTVRGIAHSRGMSWTTDAPYRETRGQVTAYQAEGVKTVEMEAAALFAVSERLGAQTAAVFVIGDRLADLMWQSSADPRGLRRSLAIVAEAIAESLSQDDYSANVTANAVAERTPTSQTGHSEAVSRVGVRLLRRILRLQPTNSAGLRSGRPSQ